LEGLLQPELASCWKNTFIKRLEIKRSSKEWRLFIEMGQPLPADLINQTTRALHKHWFFLDNLHIIPCSGQSSLEPILAQCQEEICSLESYPRSGGIEWRIRDKGIDLVSTEEEVYHDVLNKGICEGISQWFQEHYCLQVLVRAVWEEANSAAQLQPDPGIRRRPLEILDISIPTPIKSWKKAERNKANGLTPDHPALSLSDIEEGMSSAVVEGEIWDKDYTSLKDGRYIINYYLSDYRDSLIVKGFVNTKEDDGIEIGSWIKAMGSVRYDNYVKELVLIMDKYLILPKAIREDKSKFKRIELHAHTKMSAMDGLADVKELIKRAAQWKHPAIAITDLCGR
jgi:DNA polymerase-3 subunit alpha (Gram-positive type)